MVFNKRIKSVLGNDNEKRDLFYLSCPRWKDNKFKLNFFSDLTYNL